MAILTSMPGKGDDVSVYDVPDNVLAQYAVSGENASKMFPEGSKSSSGIPKSTPDMNPSKLENAESLGEVEVQAYSHICICRTLWCNAWRCWWHYYYCYC